MCDHHCIYQHGWLEAEWCDQCGFEWRSWLITWQASHPGCSVVQARGAYEALVELWCDEPLQLGPPPLPARLEQLVMFPGEHDEASAEEIRAALALRHRWPQLVQPSLN